jgi:hypothetical protein
MIDIDLASALILLSIAAVFLITRYYNHWKSVFAIDDGPPYGTFEEFIAATPQLNDNDKTAEPSLFLVDKVSKMYDEVSDATKTNEAKATTILGFVGGGASVIAVTSAGGNGHVAITALLGLALICFLGTLFACLMCLVGRQRQGLPELREQLASTDVLNDPRTTKARLAGFFFLITENRVMSFLRINLVKAYYIELGQQLFALGVLALVANFAVTAMAPTSPPKPTVVRCQASGRAVTTSKAFTCTTDNGALHAP